MVSGNMCGLSFRTFASDNENPRKTSTGKLARPRIESSPAGKKSMAISLATTLLITIGNYHNDLGLPYKFVGLIKSITFE